jgi:NADH-quinone oxidoreductase subunit N
MNQVAFAPQLWAGEISLIALIILLTLAEIFQKKPVYALTEAAFDLRNRQAGLVAAIGMGFVFLITLIWGQGGLEFAQSILNFSLKVGGGTAVGKVALVGAGLLTILLSYRYTVSREIPAADFYLLLAFSMLGALTLICAENLLVIFLALEMMSIPVYALVGLQRYKSRAGESALKYLLLGGFSSAFLLLGISFLYGASGSLQVSQVLHTVSSLDAANPSMTLLAGAGLILLFVGLAFKVSLFPFHAWTPDVYEGAATPVTAYMSVVIKLSAFAVILRIFGGATHFAMFDGLLSPIITLLALATVIYGNSVALVQQNVKRMLAYSSIAHAGYMALAIAPMQHTLDAAQAVLFYGMGYVAMNTLAFGVLIYLTQRDFYCEKLDDLRGLAKSHPVAAAAMALAMFSLAGIPPAVGFAGKLQVFLQLINAKMYVTTVIALLASLVSLYFYLNVIIQMYMREAEGTPPEFEPTGKMAVGVVLLVSAAVTLIFGIFPSPLMDWARNWAQSLF